MRVRVWWCVVPPRIGRMALVEPHYSLSIYLYYAMSGTDAAYFIKILPVEQQKGQTLTAPLQTISKDPFQRRIKRDNRYIYVYIFASRIEEKTRHTLQCITA